MTPSLPTGASVFVLAERYATYTRRASCLVPHAFAVFTVTAVLIWASG